ncbi:hypothetical protein HMPREF9104_00826, partial [Lentilactobacillus kisonensis F0435]
QSRVLHISTTSKNPKPRDFRWRRLMLRTLTALFRSLFLTRHQT